MEFLQKNNFEIEENPNAVVPEEGYNLLIKEFSTDKNLRIQSDKFTQERQNKEKPKPKRLSPRPRRLLLRRRSSPLSPRRKRHLQLKALMASLR